MSDALASFAYTRGRRDGLGLLSPSLNPYPADSAEAEQWREGHQSTQDQPCLAPKHHCPLAVGECDKVCYIRDCEKGNHGPVYGPGNPDYEYDRRREERDAA